MSELPGKLKESFPGSFSVFFHALKNLQILPFLCFYFTKLFITLIEAAPARSYNKETFGTVYERCQDGSGIPQPHGA